MALDIAYGPEHDRWRSPTAQGSYEWWYFDGIDERSGYAFVAIFFLGIPFSGARQRATTRAIARGERDPAARYPAVAFSLYGPDGTEMYLVNLHDEEEASIDGNGLGISIAESRAWYEKGVYHAEITDQQLDTTPLHATLRLTPAPIVPREGTGVGHLWVVAAPRARFELTVRSGDRELQLEGFGYHDHNVGTTSLQEQFARWDWGRVHFRDRTIVWYEARGREAGRSAYEIIVEEDGTISTGEVSLEPVRLARNLYGLSYPRELVIRGERDQLALREQRIVDNGPFYCRMLGQVQSGNETAQGFSEILRPEALDWRWFRPLLDTRVRPADSSDRIGRKITAWLVKQGL